MSEDSPAPQSFSELALGDALVAALSAVGYETPTPIQRETIPLLLAGRDVIGQAQTGTGKTAAFALPILARIDLARAVPQALVLTPTRELAIQVAEAFQRYAVGLRGFHVLPIYGGQDYGVQLRALRRGVHVVVGTPGRVMDHMRRATLALDQLACLVLDEADEMLRMGFIDDVEWVLGETPANRQVALFSATMPPPIRAIAERHLREPATISIRMQTTTAATIRQRYCVVSGAHKLDALTRILEGESFEGVLVFMRTRHATLELAERLQARGFACTAINGDMPQKQREKTIGELREGKLDILVATDVAARGLDVERVSHVINYDIPYDPEVYVHRIGRTGRAGRLGDAILLVAQREMRMLRTIERATNQPIERMELPSAELINDKRMARFMQSITDTLAGGDLDDYVALVERYQTEHDADPRYIAAALAKLVQGDEPLLIEPTRAPVHGERAWRERPQGDRDRDRERAPRRQDQRFERAPFERQRPRDGERDFVAGERPPPRAHERTAPRAPLDRTLHTAGAHDPQAAGARPRDDSDRFERGAPRRDEERPPRRIDAGMERFRIEVGHRHGVMPGNIVGAIAGETGLDGRVIGRIDIRDDHSLVDLPEGMPKEIFQALKRAWVSGQQLQISRLGEPREDSGAPRKHHGAQPPRAKPKDRHRLRKNKGAPRKRD
ncbi:MAG: DEAD/DEAH box helicase [Gammaproteobacteria bacterium]